MPKISTKHSHFHWVHLIAVFTLGGYFVLSKVNLIYALKNNNFISSFLQLFIFGTFFTYLFLYLFSHEKFFPFAKEIEDKEKKKEKLYLEKYIHHGKILGTFIIGIIGGPLFLSLTTRLLLSRFKYKYSFVLITSFVSTLFTFAVGTGFMYSILK